MERVIFLEILDRRGRVRERARVAQLPVRIGRAYTNHVIVDDRFVSPEHCLIRETEEGALLVEDLGSRNGVVVLSSPRRASGAAIHSGDRFRIGETVLRLVEAGHGVAPAEPLPKDEGGLLQSLRDRRFAAATVVVCLLALALDAYLAAYYETNWVVIVSPAVLSLGGLALWAGVWSFANRLLTHRFDFLRHLACAGLATVAIVVLSSAAEYVEFFTSSEELGAAIALLGQAGATFALLGAHLAILPASTRRRRRLWAGVGMTLLLGLLHLASYEGAEGLVSELPVALPLKAFGGNWVPATSAAEFLDEARWVREWVDEAALAGGR